MNRCSGVALAGVVLVLALGGVLLAVASLAAVGSLRTGSAWMASVQVEAAAWSALEFQAPPVEGDTVKVTAIPLGDSLAAVTAEAARGDAAWTALLLARPEPDSTGSIRLRPIPLYARANPRP
jgi:hypothetical protein